MLNWFREKFGKVVVGGIISFIAFVFIFYGVLSPKSTRGLHEGAVAGTVNGDSISISEFNRELNRRVEYFKNMGGGAMSEEQLKAFRVREGVFHELVNRKLMWQEAQRLGLLAADHEVMEKIREIPAFQKDGKFDFATYKQVLESNNHTPGSFEKLVREDVSTQKWESYFDDRVHVSESELKSEYAINQDKRNVKYVLLTPDSAKKNLTVAEADVQKYLGDTASLNLVKMKFEEGKAGLYKGQKFEAVKTMIARNILAGQKSDEIQKVNSNLADQIANLMTSNKASDVKINALLKSYGVQVKTTGLLNRKNFSIPEVGEAKELLTDAFALKSPIDSTQSGKPKKYSLAGRTLVALVVENHKPDLTQWDHDRDSLFQQTISQKSRSLYQDWVTQLASKAKVETNPSIVSSGE